MRKASQNLAKLYPGRCFRFHGGQQNHTEGSGTTGIRQTRRRKATSEVKSNQLETKDAGREIIKLKGELLQSKTEQINEFQNLVDAKLKDTIKTFTEFLYKTW